jgi:aspartate kinase
MNILVQKFGGTSVESYEKMNKVCEIIEKYKDNGHDLVIVVSAMGRKGAPYATDTLIQLCKQVNEHV